VGATDGPKRAWQRLLPVSPPKGNPAAHSSNLPLALRPSSFQVLVVGILCQKRERYMPKPRAHIRQQSAPIPFQLSFDPSSSPGFFHSRQTGFANRKAMAWARRYASFLLTPALACMRRGTQAIQG
jgi:hypothetical protein